MNGRCIYYVEGECERQLINALKTSPELLMPGKVKVYNVTQTLIPKSQLLSIQPKTTVALVFDTDVGERKYLDKNFALIKKYCQRVQIINLMQVLNFEDEIEKSTDVKKAQDLTKSTGVSKFKNDFCRLKTDQCRSLLDRHKFDIGKIWVSDPPDVFKDLEQGASIIRTAQDKQ